MGKSLKEFMADASRQDYTANELYALQIIEQLSNKIQILEQLNDIMRKQLKAKDEQIGDLLSIIAKRPQKRM